MKKFMEEHILLLFMVFVGTLTYMVGLRDKEAMKQEIDNNIIYLCPNGNISVKKIARNDKYMYAFIFDLYPQSFNTF